MLRDEIIARFLQGDSIKGGKTGKNIHFFSLKGVNVKRDRRNLNHSKTLIINSLQITLQCQWHSSRREIARLG